MIPLNDQSTQTKADRAQIHGPPNPYFSLFLIQTVAKSCIHVCSCLLSLLSQLSLLSWISQLSNCSNFKLLKFHTALISHCSNFILLYDSCRPVETILLDIPLKGGTKAMSSSLWRGPWQKVIRFWPTYYYPTNWFILSKYDETKKCSKMLKTSTKKP